MTDNYDPVPDLAELVVSALGYNTTDPAHYAGRVTMRLRIGEDDSVQEVASALRKALGLKARLCSISGPGEVIPPACPVHGIPCEDCGGVESCTDDCGERDPAGTVTDLASGEPRTVFRARGCLLIPELRLDAKGCALLRQVINNEIADLADAHAVSG